MTEPTKSAADALLRLCDASDSKWNTDKSVTRALRVLVEEVEPYQWSERAYARALAAARKTEG